MIQNLPEGFEFVEYKSVWSYYGTAMGRPDFQVDISAYAPEGLSIIGEVKNRENAPFSSQEAREFLDKMETLKEMEQIAAAIGLVFSRSGFSQPSPSCTTIRSPTVTMNAGWNSDELFGTMVNQCFAFHTKMIFAVSRPIRVKMSHIGLQ